jgi:cyanuric acid amidohydrolase
MPRASELFRCAARSADDLSGLVALCRGGLAIGSVRAIWCKTDGTGLSNDYSRAYADAAIRSFLADALGCTPTEAAARVQIVVSGGSEGIVSPHLLVLAEIEGGSAPSSEPGLVSGSDRQPFPRDEAGGQAHANFTADMVRRAAAQAGLDTASSAAFVMVKSPVQPGSSAAAIRARAAVAAGVGLATGRLSALPPAFDAPFDGPDNVFAVARSDETDQQVVVLGNAAGSSSRQSIASGALADPLDARGVAQVAAALGFAAAPQLRAEDARRIVGVFAKGDPPAGSIRDFAHTMETDPTLPSHRQGRAAYAAMIAAIVGMPAIFVSGGADGHGPAQGGLVAIVADKQTRRA